MVEQRPVKASVIGSSPITVATCRISSVGKSGCLVSSGSWVQVLYPAPFLGGGAFPKIIYDAKKQQSLRDHPGGFIFFAKIHKKMLDMARIVCYHAIKTRGDKS
jgi:hypothetical protein